MNEVINKAAETTKERGHLDSMSNLDKENLFRTSGLGGLKYYLLKVDPKKGMMFNPDESIELTTNSAADECEKIHAIIPGETEYLTSDFYVDSVVSFESFRALKLSNSERLRALKLSLFETFRAIEF